MRKRFFELLDSSAAGGLAGRVVGVILISLIVISAIASILASIQSLYAEYRRTIFETTGTTL